METKTKLYPNGSVYKREIMHLCPESDGTNPCVSYNDSNERIVALTASPLPVSSKREANTDSGSEASRKKEKRRYFQLGNRLISAVGSNKQGDGGKNRKRRSQEPKPDVVIIQSASRRPDWMPDAPMPPNTRSSYGTYYSPHSPAAAKPNPLQDPIVLKESPVRRRRPTSVSFVEGNPVLIDDAPRQRRRPTSGTSFADQYVSKSTPPRTPGRGYPKAEYFSDHLSPYVPVSPPPTPDQELFARQRQRNKDSYRRLDEDARYLNTYRDERDNMRTDETRQARLDLERIEAREAARLRDLSRLRTPPAEVDVARSQATERQLVIDRTREHMAREREMYDARQYAERLAGQTLDVRSEERHEHEELDQEIRDLGRTIKYYEQKQAEEKQKAQTRPMESSPQLSRPADARRHSAHLPPVVIQPSRPTPEQLRREGQRVLAEARRERPLSTAVDTRQPDDERHTSPDDHGIQRRASSNGPHSRRSSIHRDTTEARRERPSSIAVESRQRHDERHESPADDSMRRRASTSGAHGRRSSIYYRDTARRMRQFWGFRS